MAELENLVDQMENGQLSLDSMLKAYERGAQLVHVCKTRLSAIEQQVKILDGEVLKQFESPNASSDSSDNYR